MKKSLLNNFLVLLILVFALTACEEEKHEPGIFTHKEKDTNGFETIEVTEEYNIDGILIQEDREWSLDCDAIDMNAKCTSQSKYRPGDGLIFEYVYVKEYSSGSVFGEKIESKYNSDKTISYVNHTVVSNYMGMELEIYSSEKADGTLYEKSMILHNYQLLDSDVGQWSWIWNTETNFYFLVFDNGVDEPIVINRELTRSEVDELINYNYLNAKGEIFN